MPNRSTVRGVEVHLALVVSAGNFAIADSQPLRQVRQKEVAPFVLRRSKAEGVSQHRHKDFEHVVSCDARRNREHQVDDDKFPLIQGRTGRKPLEKLVGTDNHKQAENNVEEERDGDRMTRVPDDLHLNDPVAVNRNEKGGDEEGFDGNTFDRLLLRF